MEALETYVQVAARDIKATITNFWRLSKML